MSRQRPDVAALIESCSGGQLPARYRAFFACFNRQRFFEAHEVLEALWLEERRGPQADLFQGLIQLAAAFVHLEKNRPGPAAALLRLAQAHLRGFPGVHLGLDMAQAHGLIAEWLGKIAAKGFDPNRQPKEAPPQLNFDLSCVNGGSA